MTTASRKRRLVWTFWETATFCLWGQAKANDCPLSLSLPPYVYISHSQHLHRHSELDSFFTASTYIAHCHNQPITEEEKGGGGERNMSIRSRVRSLKEKRPSLDDEPSTATQLVDRRDEDKTAVAPTTRNSLITLSPSSSFARRAMMGTANLAKLLPSGTLLAFQLLTPIFTRNGSCDPTTQTLTLGLLLILAASCFLGCLTDSFRASDGQVYYGLATFKGMWLFDYPSASASGIPGNLSVYRLRLIDAVHAVLSVLVFGVVALKDRNVVSCFYPSPEHETKEILDIVPVGIGLICSLLFMAFPTTRHGFGYPIASTG